MKSLKDLTDELLGVRLYAVNTSLWYQGATLTEAARQALNEAVRTYEFRVKRTYNSLSLPDTGQTVAVLPKDVDRIVEIWAQSTTSSGPRRLLKGGYDYRPTQETNLLYMDAKTFPSARNVDIHYESRVTEIPRQAVVGTGGFGVSQGAIFASGAVPAAEWRAPGYLVITPQITSAGNDTTHREVIRYHAVTATSFTGLQRGVGGLRTVQVAQAWSLGDVLSPVLEVPDEALPVILHAAQAEMYHFWVRNRALYEEFTAIASLQQLDLGDLLGLIRSEEDRADRRWKKTKSPPTPTHAKRKRHRQ